MTRQVANALWIAGDLPWEYTELRLCRDVYHCLPSELADEPWATIRKHMAIMEAEARNG